MLSEFKGPQGRWMIRMASKGKKGKKGMAYSCLDTSYRLKHVSVKPRFYF